MEKFFILTEGNPISDSVIKLTEPKDIFVDNSLSKVFRQKEGSNIITCTPYFAYMLAAQAKASFGRFIIEADKECVYHSEQATEVVDDKALAEFVEANKKAKEEYNSEYAAQRSSHMDWFETQTSIANIAEYVSPYIKSDKLYVPKNLVSIVDSYKFANAYLKEIGKSEELPRIEKKVISKAFEDEWKSLVANIKESTGYKTEAELKQEVLSKGYVKTDKKTRLTLNRQPAKEIQELTNFSESFLSFIFESELEKLR